MEWSSPGAGVIDALAQGSRVNVFGLLGVGKTRSVSTLPDAVLVDAAESHDLIALTAAIHEVARSADPGQVLVIDSVDGAAREKAVLDALPPDRPVVLVSRRPLAAVPGWDELELVPVELRPWSSARVGRLVEGLTDEQRSVVLELSGGVPAIALAGVRAVAAGLDTSALGPFADFVVAELGERLTRELSGRQEHALRLVAAVGRADERIIGGPVLFDQLSRASFIVRTQTGLAVREPFRSLIDLAYGWRSPERRLQVRERTSRYRVQQLMRTDDPELRVAVAEQALFVSENSGLRNSVFPPLPGGQLVRRASRDDAESVAALMRAWSGRIGIEKAVCDRLTEAWVNDDVSAFHVAQNQDGDLTAMIRLAPVGEATIGGIEPLLQQHGDTVVTGAGGYFLGAAFSPDRIVHAQLLRQILRTAMTQDSLIVSTASTDYQDLLAALRFTDHGSTRDDVLRCGRPPKVYSVQFTPADLPSWIRALGGSTGRIDPDMVARALSLISDPARLARSPLAAAHPQLSPSALARRLQDAVAALIAGPTAVDGEAGRILAGYYLGRHRSHQRIARETHVSRATYFRRLRYGLDAVAAQFNAQDAMADGLSHN